MIYVGYGCNGLAEAKELAIAKNVADMIQWQDFYSAEELARVYQQKQGLHHPVHWRIGEASADCAW